MAICPNCGNQTGEGAIFCDQCGARLPTETTAPDAVPAPAGGTVICPACGAGNVPGEAFCDYCGSPLEAPLPTAEAEAVVEEAAPVESEVEGETAAVAEEAPAPAEAEGLVCPACGAAVQPGEAFCPVCGASLAQPPLPPEAVSEAEIEAAVEEVVEAEAGVVAAVEEVTEAEAEVEAAEPQAAVEEAAPAAGPLTCPACGAEVEEGDAFCSACGYALQAAPAPAVAAVEEEAVPSAPPAAGPRLVVSDSAAEIPLPAGDEILIGREDPVSGIFPEIDLTPHGGEDAGVSRRHARLIVEGGDYFVEDLDSTNFTFVNKQKLAPRTRQQVGDGDEIRCGRLALVLRL